MLIFCFYFILKTAINFFCWIHFILKTAIIFFCWIHQNWIMVQRKYWVHSMSLTGRSETCWQCSHNYLAEHCLGQFYGELSIHYLTYVSPHTIKSALCWIQILWGTATQFIVFLTGSHNTIIEIGNRSIYFLLFFSSQITPPRVNNSECLGRDCLKRQPSQCCRKFCV